MQIKPIKRASNIRIYRMENYQTDQIILEVRWDEWEFSNPSLVWSEIVSPQDSISFSSPSTPKGYRCYIDNEFLYTSGIEDIAKMLYVSFDPILRLDIPELNQHIYVWIQKATLEISSAVGLFTASAPPSAKPKTDFRLSGWAKDLPGIREMVKNPVTEKMDALHHVIINLNDRHKWTREQIADWIETLDIDTRFKVD